MQSLHHLVVFGKVLHLGISDTPAWIVSRANEYARGHGLTQFSVYQGHWSASVRDFERDIIPMCEFEGMALAPWGSLGRGLYRSPEEFASTRSKGRKMGSQTESSKAVSAALDEIAKKKGTKITSVALAYVRAKSAYVFPIVGCRTKRQLLDNIEALSIELSEAEVDSIEAATPHFDVGFPMTMLFCYGGVKYNTRMTSSDIPLLKASVHLDVPTRVGPPKPHAHEG
jgi:aryl-alcohol dehydrogenase-like predicted oxidoreductase